MSIRVLHVMEDFSSGNTGVTSVVRQIAQWQANHCEWVGVYSTGSTDLPAPKGVHLDIEAVDPGYRSWRYPVSGEKQLYDLIKRMKVNVVHLHGLWRAAPLIGAKVARNANVPTVLSVHGQTSPWALGGQGVSKRLKKFLYWQYVACRQLREVTALHAITPLERDHLAKFFKRPDSVVIPNAIDLASQEIINEPDTPRREFVFLGRLHPVKGVDLLIEAFSSARFADEDWRLVLAGPAEVPEYFKRLQDQVSRSARRDRIEFAGPVYDRDKLKLLRGAWALIAPSHSEVIGMVNLEAAVQKVPSVTTHLTGLVDWEQGGGVLISPTVDDLKDAMEAASTWSLEERFLRGSKSEALVHERYSQSFVGPRWIQLYEKVKTNFQ
jgi:glycosyltransferase involved in cell wall biosynthesis